MARHLSRWLRLPLAMVGWAAIVVAAEAEPRLGLAAGLVLVALFLWWLRATAEEGQTWADTVLIAVIWAGWALGAWLGVLFAAYLGYFVGAYFGWWEINDE